MRLVSVLGFNQIIFSNSCVSLDVATLYTPGGNLYSYMHNQPGF